MAGGGRTAARALVVGVAAIGLAGCRELDDTLGAIARIYAIVAMFLLAAIALLETLAIVCVVVGAARRRGGVVLAGVTIAGVMLVLHAMLTVGPWRMPHWSATEYLTWMLFVPLATLVFGIVVITRLERKADDG